MGLVLRDVAPGAETFIPEVGHLRNTWADLKPHIKRLREAGHAFVDDALLRDRDGYVVDFADLSPEELVKAERRLNQQIEDEKRRLERRG